jgi:hypothetical protein
MDTSAPLLDIGSEEDGHEFDALSKLRDATKRL